MKFQLITFLNESIVLNNNNNEFKSIQSEADNSNYDINSTNEFDNTSSHNSISKLIDDDFNLRIFLFNFTTADNSDADDYNDC